MTIHSGMDLLSLGEEHGSIGAGVLAHEAAAQSLGQDKVRAQMHRALVVMKEAVETGTHRVRRSLGGLIGGEAAKLNTYKACGKPLAGSVAVNAARMALAVSEVNASMGRIVAAPTAGSCGILPGAILALAEDRGYSDDELVLAMFVAAGVGMVIARNATISGAEGGCQAECGAAAAMAAAACAFLGGGAPDTCLHAAALALKNELGLACDPIAGLVEVPCAKRNALKAAEAVLAADMALAGIESVIPFDEVVLAMRQISREMPESIRETATGGLAATPTGQRLKKQILDSGSNEPV